MAQDTQAARIRVSRHSSQQGFGASRLLRALADVGQRGRLVHEPGGAAEVQVWLEPGDARLGREGFRIHRMADGELAVIGHDETGAMYGLLHLAEQVRMRGSLAAVEQHEARAHFELRALKFNLPWSSYRPGEVMSLHTETCRDPAFWASLLDMLAENRFNALSLWSMHPFPWMVRPRDYPEGWDLDDAEFDRFRALWRFVFREARMRGIDTYVVIWNIFVSDSFARAHNIEFPGDEYLWGQGDTSDLVKQYNRQCITQLIEEYEDLSGLGVSLGDRMQNLSPQQREQWVEEVTIRAVKEARRPIKFIHRAPFLGDPTHLRAALDRAELPGPTYVEYKFNWSHAHSTPHLAMTHQERPAVKGAPQPIDDRYWNPRPANYRMAWMARNEDFFILRWGQSDFIRQHIQANTSDVVAGYFVGSEGYVPAKDYSHRPSPHVSWDYAFQKQWMFYSMGGRLLYDPATPDVVFEAQFEQRHGAGVGRPMLRALKLASQTPLRIASFYAATWDYTLYSEGFLAAFPSFGLNDQVSPLISVDELIDHPTLDPRLLSIRDFVAGAEPQGRTSPLELADQCETDAAEALGIVEQLRSRTADAPTLGCELDDIAAWSQLQLYFAHKLRGAVALARYRNNGDEQQKAQAIAALKEAAERWEALCRITDAHYHEVPYIQRTDREIRFAWSNFKDQVARDVQIAEAAQRHSPPAT